MPNAERTRSLLATIYADGYTIEDGPEVVRIAFWVEDTLPDDTVYRRAVGEFAIQRRGFANSLSRAVARFPVPAEEASQVASIKPRAH